MGIIEIPSYYSIYLTDMNPEIPKDIFRDTYRNRKTEESF
jgi:hypothetical protein